MNNTINLIGRIFLDKLTDHASYYDHCGADALFYMDQASFEGEHGDVKGIKAICGAADIPLYVCGKVKRFEDIKKMIYAGAAIVIVDENDPEDPQAVKEAIGRFGADRIYLMTEVGDPEETLERVGKLVEDQGYGGVVCKGDACLPEVARAADFLKVNMSCPVFVLVDAGEGDQVARAGKMSMADGLILNIEEPVDMMEVKQNLNDHQIPVNLFESALDFSEFKLNSDGMIPCITQDYRTGEVLMLAYMTKESFEKTIATGKMTYYSRSRQELWTKGDTSGHYQYVKSLTIDCDKDTILARVAQIGAACHTGNRTCFFTDLVKKEDNSKNPLGVFEEVFATICDRKENPKEGSYTNYLFDQGVDKILKKVGEEATEIVIAAKNPDSDELKYEICDFLYHMMVLMADQDVTWKEITEELAQRH